MILCPPDDNGITPSDNGYGMAPIGAIATVTTAIALGINVTANVKLRNNTQQTITEIQDIAEKEIREYLAEVCSEWGTMGSWRSVDYSVVIYYNRISAILNSIQGVIVANNILLNNGEQDLVLTEQPLIDGQQVPMFESIDLTIEG
jgi:hypothetical protein